MNQKQIEGGKKDSITLTSSSSAQSMLAMCNLQIGNLKFRPIWTSVPLLLRLL